MSGKTTAGEHAPSTEPQAVAELAASTEFGQWLFVDVAPTPEAVAALLATVPPVFDVRVADFADYVQALPQKMKLEAPHPTNPRLKVEESHDTWVLYVSVAGRVRMAQAITELHGWALDFVPEPVTPTGVPGYLQMDGKLVYREYVVFRPFWGPSSDGSLVDPVALDQAIGRRPGTAWAPSSGGKAAEGSNPYEVVETSARGRALAAWGIGVLPGSGIASLEEMRQAATNGRALEREAAEQGRIHGTGRPPVDRGELVEQVLTLAETLRQRRHMEDADKWNALGISLAQLGVENAVQVEAGLVDWDRVKTGQLGLLRNKLQDTLEAIAAAGDVTQ